jgi:hypothetical protein
MSTEKQKEAARRNIEKAREVRSERAHGEDIPRRRSSRPSGSRPPAMVVTGPTESGR